MKKFLQLHLLTVYPPSNPNRDDMGRPKSALFGGAPRLRISSQSLKRAWRTSQVFETTLNSHLSSRTRRIGEEIYKYLVDHNLDDKEARTNARKIADVFGKLKPEKEGQLDSFHTEQLAFISRTERERAFALADLAIAGEDINPKPQDVLLNSDTAADVAMFGRMLADDPEFNREAAVQVSHAITTHKAVAEDDYYTALDDFEDETQTGAGFVGVQEFGSGVYYLYICVNRILLLENVSNDQGIFRGALDALVRAATSVGPSGKRSSFASYPVTNYILAELSDLQPRSLAAAFLQPISASDYCAASVDSLKEFSDKLDQAYEFHEIQRCELNVSDGTSSISDIVKFCTG